MSEEYTRDNGADGEQVETDRPVRKRKKRRKKRYLLKILLFLLFCVGGYFLLHSSLFAVKDIHVTASSRFPAEQVIKTVGLKPGMNLFEYNKGECEDKLEQNPYIKNATIKRKLPDGIAVALVERVGIAAIKKDKTYVIIDREGTILEIVEKKPATTILNGITAAGDIKLKGKIQINEQRQYDRALDILDTMKKEGLFFQTLEMSGIVVNADVGQGLICRGKTENLIEGMKSQNLQAVLNDLKSKGIKKGVVNIGDNQYFSFNKKVK